MNKLATFLYRAHCEEKNGKLFESSKRWWGGFGFFIMTLCVAAIAITEVCITGTVSSMTATLIMFHVGACTTLLGISSITGAIAGNKMSIGNTKQNPINDEDNTDQTAETMC